MDTTRRFAELVTAPSADEHLGEIAALIATHARPELDVAKVLAGLDELSAGVPEPSLDGLLDHLYDACGFHGNRSRYDDADNSFLDQVLERRTGIPISLAVVLIEVGRRAGVPLVGIGMPGHFLVRLAGDPEQFVDPFDGVRLDSSDCEERFRVTQGDFAEFHDEYLEPVTAPVIAARILMNLKQTYLRAEDTEALAWVLRLRTLIPGVPVHERNELAAVLTARARYDEAADVLESLLDVAVLDEDRDRLIAKATLLRARLN